MVDVSEHVRTLRALLGEWAQHEETRTYVGLIALAVMLFAAMIAFVILRAFLRLVYEAYTGVVELLFPFGRGSVEDVTLSDRKRAQLFGAETTKPTKNAPPPSKGGKKTTDNSKKQAPAQATPSSSSASAKKKPAIQTMYSSDRMRNDTPSAQFETVKGFRTAISVVAFATGDADLVFMGTEDRQYKLFRASTLGKTCESVVMRLDKATVTHAQFDGTGRVLAVYVDNERMLRIYNVRFDARDNFNLVWEVRVPPMALSGVGVGPGGGYALLMDEGGEITVLSRLGKELTRAQNKQGSVRQWRFSAQGNLLGLAGSMSSSCRVWCIMSGNRSTLDDGPLWGGVTVEAWDHGSRRFYPAVVVEQDSTGTYTIRWNEGGLEAYHIPRNELRPTGVQTKGETYNSMSHAMTLLGHKLGVTCVGFSPDGTRAVSCSEDGGVRVWDIAVRWNLGEEPKLLASFCDTDYCYFTHAAVSPNNKILVLGTPSTSILVYRIDSKEPSLLGEISDTHPRAGQLKDLYFTSKNIVMTVAHSDSKAKLWNLASRPPPYSIDMKA